MIAILIVLIAAFLVWDTADDRRRLISIAGLLTFIAVGFIFSKHPTRVSPKNGIQKLQLLDIVWAGKII